VAHGLEVEELATAHVLQIEEIAMAHALQARTAQTPLGTVLMTTHIHPTCLAKVRGWAKNHVLWCNAEYVPWELGRLS
jgi:hypothetical protein